MGDKNKENLAAPAEAPEPPAKEKGKKRKLEETDDSVLEPAEKKGKFDWDEIITSILTKKEEMKLVKLKKKCIAEFMAQFPDTHKSQEKLGSKFDKMLKKRKYKVLKDKVMLAHPDDEEKEEAAEETPTDNGHQKQNGVADSTNGVHTTNGEQQQKRLPQTTDIRSRTEWLTPPTECTLPTENSNRRDSHRQRTSEAERSG